MTVDLNAVSALLTLLFGLASVFFYLKSRRTKRPVFVFDRVVLQARTHPKVTILFEGRPVEVLSRARVLFFNAGSEPIRSSDIPNGQYPTIRFAVGTKMFSTRVIAVSRPEIAFAAVAEGEHAVALRFLFLNQGDGAVVEVLYDLSPEPGDESLQAVVIGGRQPRRYQYWETLPRWRIATSIILAVVVGGPAIILVSKAICEGNWILVAGLAGLCVGVAGVISAEVATIARSRLPAFARRAWKQEGPDWSDTSPSTAIPSDGGGPRQSTTADVARDDPHSQK